MKTILIVLVVIILGAAIFWFNQEPAVAPNGLIVSPGATTTASPVTKTTIPNGFLCQPYVCTDGYQAPRCTEGGVLINYLVNPCQYHGGEVISREEMSSPIISPIATPQTTKTPTSSPTPSPTTYLITFASGTASSLNVEIKAGDTIKFVNNDDAQRWPASGVHPTHQICPGFDSLRGLNRGESYSFTFREPKTCPWHDHLNPLLRGQIIITP